MIDVDPQHKEGFNRCYNEEHLPERLACPGSLNGRWLVAVAGEPKHLALYYLESPEVLRSEAHKKIYGPSGWSQRISKHFIRSIRNVYLKTTPENLGK